MKAALRTARRLGQSEGGRAWLSSTSNLQQAAEAAPTVGPLEDALPSMHSHKSVVHASKHASEHAWQTSAPTAPSSRNWFCLQVPDAAVNSTEVTEAHRHTLGVLQVGAA